MKEDLTPAEKIYVRKSIEQHKLGTNKTILQQVQSERWDGKARICCVLSTGPSKWNLGIPSPGFKKQSEC